MVALPRRRDQVFISYSRNDAKWLDLLTKHLKPYIRASQMDVWDDRRIYAGDDWRLKIKEALERAGVAVLLVTPDFLASEFIINNELPHFLEKAHEGGLKILWIAVKASGVAETPITKYQALNNPKQPLIMRHYAHRDDELNRLSCIIRDTWVSQCSHDIEATEVATSADSPATTTSLTGGRPRVGIEKDITIVVQHAPEDKEKPALETNFMILRLTLKNFGEKSARWQVSKSSFDGTSIVPGKGGILHPNQTAEYDLRTDFYVQPVKNLSGTARIRVEYGFLDGLPSQYFVEREIRIDNFGDGPSNRTTFTYDDAD